MLMYIIVLAFTFPSFYFVTSMDLEELSGPITKGDYEEFIYDRICKASVSQNAVKTLCAKLENRDLQRAYKESEIKKRSGCEDTFVRVISDSGEAIDIPTSIGICRLSPDETAALCVSGSIQDSDVLVWKREVKSTIAWWGTTIPNQYRCTHLGLAKRMFPSYLNNYRASFSKARLMNESRRSLRGSAGSGSGGPLRGNAGSSSREPPSGGAGSSSQGPRYMPYNR